MILLLAIGCTYPAFLGPDPSDTDPSDTDPSDTDPGDTDPGDTDPVDTDVPSPCGEEHVPSTPIELDTDDGAPLFGAFALAAGGPGELLVLEIDRVSRVQVQRDGTTSTATFVPHGSFDAAGTIDGAFDRLGVAGDLDHDGALDVPLFRSNGPCVVHLHPFDGAAPASITVGTSVRACAIVDDATGDGSRDLLISDLLVQGASQGVSLWEGATLTSAATPWATFVLEDFAFGVVGPSALADLDGDLLRELVFAAGGEDAGDAPAVGAVAVGSGSTEVTNAAVRLRSVAQGTQTEASLALGDWDGDGDVDPAAAFWSDPTGAGSLLGHAAEVGPIGFEAALFRWSATAPTELARSAVGLGDFDGGGCDDLAVVAPGGASGRIEVYSGTSLRGDVSAVVPAVGISAADAHLLGRGLFAPGDLDLDGTSDLIVLGWEGTTSGIVTAHLFFGR